MWSNRYHFNGGTPADATHWHTLMDAVVAAEKACYDNNVTIVSAVGYAAGSDVPVASKDYTTVGTASFAGTSAPSECVALARWSTPARSSKNHPIYLFNYFHGVQITSGSGKPEKVDPDQKSAIETYGSDWISGFSDGSITAVRAGPNGVTAGGILCEEYITHRDFPYRTSV